MDFTVTEIKKRVMQACQDAIMSFFITHFVTGINSNVFFKNFLGQVRWLTAVIPATQEAEAGGVQPYFSNRMGAR